MKKLLKTTGLIVLIVILGAAAYLIIAPLTETHKNTDRQIGNNTWMSGISDDKLISEIWIPGTHDSGTQYAALPYFSKCQAASVGTQLEDGFRYLDIRLGIKDGRLVFWHGFCLCRTGFLPWSGALELTSVLQECYDFLAKNPSETIIFAVKAEHGEGGEAFQKLLHQEIDKDASHWLLTDSIPTLKECRGKLVLMRRYEDALGLGKKAGIPMDWANQSGKDDVSLNAAVEKQAGYTLVVQDRYKYGTDDKWNAFKQGLTVKSGQEPELRLHFLSTNGTPAYGHPYTYAKELDQRLMTEEWGADRPGWIIVDFGNWNLAEEIRLKNW